MKIKDTNNTKQKKWTVDILDKENGRIEVKFNNWGIKYVSTYQNDT